MSGLPYHKRYHSDALAGFMPLSLEERGAYQTLLDMMYDRGGPLLDNERLLAGYMNCSIRKWRALRNILISKGKISLNDDGLITNGRAEKEIENTAKTSRTLAEAGAKGGRTRAENEKKGNENKESGQASLEPKESQPQAILEARSQSSEANASGGEPPADPLKQMFDLGVHLLTETGCTEKQARSLLGKWRKAKSPGDVISGLVECRARAISNPVEWLERRFQAARYVSASGYEYRGSLEQIAREAQRRSDHNTYWQVQVDLKQSAAA